jgi:hypothetical protein
VSAPKPWPRCKRVVTPEALRGAAKLVFGHEPRWYQLKAAVKMLEGHDTLVIAGTGAGKTLIYALTGLAARMAGMAGVLIIVCPLKALQMDLVSAALRRLQRKLTQRDKVQKMNEAAERLEGTVAKGAGDMVRAIFVNEDNHGAEVFLQLRNGRAAVCFAAPETFLYNERFIRFFRDEKIRTTIPGVYVDEAHVLAEWKDDFRKAYGQLDTLSIMLGSQVPWGGGSATLGTAEFETVFKALRLGVHRPFWGLDLGTDRPNLRYEVKRMAYPMNSCTDLVSLLPDGLCATSTPEDLPKTIIYLPTKRLCRVARRLLRARVPKHLQKSIWPYYALHSEDYKSTLLAELYKGTKLRILLATNAAGMGLDIPDVMQSAIYGARRYSAAVQEGGRAVRNPALQGVMTWFVPGWMFEPRPDDEEDDDDEDPGRGQIGAEDESSADDSDEDSSSEDEAPAPARESKSAARERARREAFDQAAITFVNLAGSDTCMRRWALEHCRPRPTLRGFPDGPPREDEDQEVHWEVVSIDESTLPGKGFCCSARCCQTNDAMKLTTNNHPPPNPAPTSSSQPIEKRPKISCSNQEREKLRDTLVAWQDQQWAASKAASPGATLLGRTTLLAHEQLNHLIGKAHFILGAPIVGADLVRELAHAYLPSDATIASLIGALNEFRAAFAERHPRAGSKRAKFNEAALVQ